MNVKQVQNDTLSHFILSRASLFSLSSMGDLTYSSECLESSQIYVANSQEVKWSDEQFIGAIHVLTPEIQRLPSISFVPSEGRNTLRYVDLSLEIVEFGKLKYRK